MDPTPSFGFAMISKCFFNPQLNLLISASGETYYYYFFFGFCNIFLSVHGRGFTFGPPKFAKINECIDQYVTGMFLDFLLGVNIS